MQSKHARVEDEGTYGEPFFVKHAGSGCIRLVFAEAVVLKHGGCGRAGKLRPREPVGYKNSIRQPRRSHRWLSIAA
jgi:hypothetical protein